MRAFLLEAYMLEVGNKDLKNHLLIKVVRNALGRITHTRTHTPIPLVNLRFRTRVLILQIEIHLRLGIKKHLRYIGVRSALGRIRTLNPQSRNLVFYPVELRVQFWVGKYRINAVKTKSYQSN